MTHRIRERRFGFEVALCEALGLLMCVKPIGIPLGLYLIWRGHKASIAYNCGACSYPLENGKTTVCPCCREALVS